MSAALAYRSESSPPAAHVTFRLALRRALRRRSQEAPTGSLHQIALLQVLLVLLVLLLHQREALAGFSLDLPQRELSLPSSTLVTPPDGGNFSVFLTEKAILVGDWDEPVVSLPERENLASEGIAKGFRPSRASAEDHPFYILPLGNALQIVREQDQAIRCSVCPLPRPQSAVLVADQNTPYRLLYEVLVTLGASEVDRGHLAVKADTDHGP